MIEKLRYMPRARTAITLLAIVSGVTAWTLAFYALKAVLVLINPPTWMYVTFTIAWPTFYACKAILDELHKR